MGETGLLEEIRLNDLYVNRERNPFVFDSVLYALLRDVDGSIDGSLVNTFLNILVKLLKK